MEKTISRIVVVVLILAAIGFGLTNSIYNLGNGDQAVIQRFGEVVKIIESPGIHFKIPFIEKYTAINVRDIRSIQYGYRIENDATSTTAATYTDEEDESIVLTKGGYIVDLGAIVQYRIVDVADYLFNCQDQEATIRLAFESVLRRNMQNKDLDTALINKNEIALQVLPELQKKLDAYGLGIKISDVKLTDVLLPAKVQEAYDGVNIARNEKDRLQLDASKYENEKLPKAHADATIRINSAKAYKETKLAQARGDVIAFSLILEKYEVSKEITTKRLYIETMENILSKTKKKFIIDLDSSGNMIKYLPLNPQVIQ